MRRAVGLVLGAVLVALGTFALAAGAVLLVVVGTDGRATAPSIRAVTPTAAFVIDPARLDAGLPSAVSIGRARIQAVSLDESATFVGAGPADDVLAYLAGSPYEVARGVDGRSATLDAVTVDGDGAPSPPVAQSLWTAQSTGPGEQGIEVVPAQTPQLVVVMRADGQGPVDVRLDTEVEVEGAGAVAVAAIGAGVALTIIGVLLLSRRDRRARESAPGPTVPEAGEPVTSTPNVAIRPRPAQDSVGGRDASASEASPSTDDSGPGWGAPIAPSDTASPSVPRPRGSIDVRRNEPASVTTGPDAPPREAVPSRLQ